MKILSTEKKLCISCMQEHLIDIVETEEHETFNGVNVKFNAKYEYCSNTDEYLETEEIIKANGLAVKDAYRKAVGLLTSAEIKHIREKYNVSQKEFSEILNWGKATITRYENHQIQDRAHDDILRKIDSDPQWFLEMLNRAVGRISERSFNKYFSAAYGLYLRMNTRYLYKPIRTNTFVNVVETLPNRICVEICCRYLYSNSAITSSHLKSSKNIKAKPLFAM